MRVLGPCCTISESMSQFGHPFPKPRLAFNDDESFTIHLKAEGIIFIPCVLETN